MTKNQLPSEFEERLKSILPQRPALLFEQKPYQSFRINTLKISIEKAHVLLGEQGVDFQKIDFCPYAIIVLRETARKILDSKLAGEGLLYAQGLESMLAVMALDPRPGERILDLCAAPGSKTSQIAMLMNSQGFLQANEPVRQRLYKLKSVLSLTGAQARVSSVDGRRFKAGEGLFDRVLVDAPCSSEGRFLASEPKTFAYWSVRKIKEMSHKQKGLLLNASRLLKPGGTLVYSTCTFAPEENEEVIDWFLRKTEGRFTFGPLSMEGFKTTPCLERWQKKTYDPRVKQAIRLWPEERMDGFFIAKFVNSHYN